MGNFVKNNSVKFAVFLVLGFGFALSASAQSTWEWDQMVTYQDGQMVVHAKPFADNNSFLIREWGEKQEREFQSRAAHIVQEIARGKLRRGNTFFENEKRSYGFLMTQALTEQHRQAAIEELQAEDAQAKDWHKHTEGIDYYAAFTLKHQMRKYFYFGDVMDSDYRKRMYQGAKKWTAEDPLRKPHHAYQKKQGWGPDAKNSWVDVRSTENLFLMRVTSVYLMAEETGNKETTKKYKQIILDYAKTLYRIGIGEWDSENYHGHSMGPLLNLFDFAKDTEVKFAARACLDWYLMAGAIKYWRGGFNGPTKRDYNHPQPFGGSAAAMLWVYFGGSPKANTHWESDEIHIITSAYRPPEQIVQLADRLFAKPLTVYSSKPEYSATTSFRMDSQPEYLETQHFGHSFQVGSLAGGTRPGKTDVNGFKILVLDEEAGAKTIQAVPGDDPNFVGSPQYQENKVTGENRIAQFENALIWLVQGGDSPWSWVVPKDVEFKSYEKFAIIKADQTWVAIHPLGTTQLKVDAAKTEW